MDVRELKKLTREGESQHIEFKKKVAHPEKILKEVVAFANSEGGWLFLGIDDSGELSGLKFPEEEQDVMTNAINKYCYPQIEFSIQTVPLNQKKAVVAYNIPSSTRKPHKVALGEVNTCYVRVNDKSVKASREMQEIIRRQRKPRDMNVQYGEKEQVLMEYLQDNDFITLPQFQRIAGLNKKQASRTLVHLVLANILRIKPEEKGDKYFLHSSF